MNKKNKRKKKYQKGVFLNIIVFIMLLLLFSSYVSEQAKITDALVKRTNQQVNKIHELEKEVRDLEAENEKLEKVVVYQVEQAKAFKNKPAKVEYITETPKIKEETKEVHNFEPMPTLPTVVIGAMATLGGMARAVLPALP